MHIHSRDAEMIPHYLRDDAVLRRPSLADIDISEPQWATRSSDSLDESPWSEALLNDQEPSESSPQTSEEGAEAEWKRQTENERLEVETAKQIEGYLLDGKTLVDSEEMQVLPGLEEDHDDTVSEKCV